MSLFYLASNKRIKVHRRKEEIGGESELGVTSEYQTRAFCLVTLEEQNTFYNLDQIGFCYVQAGLILIQKILPSDNNDYNQV